MKVLQQLGTGGNVLRWFESYSTARKQATLFRREVSELKEVELGVPQGSVLGPLLFILYINDVKDTICEGEINLFADDTVLFIIADSIPDAYAILRSELERISEWLKSKKLKINVKKTKYMMITNRSRVDSGENLSIDGENIEQVKVIKYLGVMVDNKLNFSDHVDYTIRKAAQKFGVMCRINKYLTLQHKTLIYKTLVAPHFEYCPSILFLASKQQKKRMQVVQNKAMRLILGCSRSTSSVAMRDCLQWMSVEQRIMLSTLILVFKIKNGLTPNYLTEHVRYGTDVHSYETRRANDLRLPSFMMTGTQNSLFFKGFKLYNRLPRETKHETSLHRFKRGCIDFIKNHTTLEITI